MSSVRMVMVIDQRKCIGCHTCVIACKSANNVPNGYNFNRVITEGGVMNDTPGGVALGESCATTTPNIHMMYYTKACQHCDDAPCVKNCPTKATYKRKDGIVMMVPDLCVGCKNCLRDCPYAEGTTNEMRVFYENPDFYNKPVGDPNALKIVDKTVGKCTFCAHRLDDGKQPACLELCPGRARYFGNILDETSEVYAKVYLSNRTVKQIKMGTGAESNTGPSVYLLT